MTDETATAAAAPPQKSDNAAPEKPRLPDPTSADATPQLAQRRRPLARKLP